MVNNSRICLWVNLVSEGTGFWKCNEIYDCDRIGVVGWGSCLVWSWFPFKSVMIYGYFGELCFVQVKWCSSLYCSSSPNGCEDCNWYMLWFDLTPMVLGRFMGKIYSFPTLRFFPMGFTFGRFLGRYFPLNCYSGTPHCYYCWVGVLWTEVIVGALYSVLEWFW